jgi:hypothetical protein
MLLLILFFILTRFRRFLKFKLFQIQNRDEFPAISRWINWIFAWNTTMFIRVFRSSVVKPRVRWKVALVPKASVTWGVREGLSGLKLRVTAHRNLFDMMLGAWGETALIVSALEDRIVLICAFNRDIVIRLLRPHIWRLHPIPSIWLHPTPRQELGLRLVLEAWTIVLPRHISGLLVLLESHLLRRRLMLGLVEVLMLARCLDCVVLGGKVGGGDVVRQICSGFAL